MSSTEQVVPPAAGPPTRVAHPVRVRHQAREAIVLMAFSAGTSVLLALALLVITNLGR